MMVKTTHLNARYHIIESDIGPLISESRSTVYDILEAQNKGRTLLEISGIYNLTPLQVETAFRYIEQHRAKLQLELDKIIKIAEERHQHYEAIYQEVRRKIDAQPMTPARKRLREIIAENRTGQAANANNSQ